jgi:ABC-type Fe3+ transport system substrate-binding protein
LLDPKWTGKIALAEENYSWYGALTQKWGRDETQRYMRVLAKQDIQLRSGEDANRAIDDRGRIFGGNMLAPRVKK